MLQRSLMISLVKNNRYIKKEGINFAKTAAKRIVQKTTENSGDKIGDLLANKITSLGNKPNFDEKYEQPEEVIIPPEKRQQIIDGLKLF